MNIERYWTEQAGPYPVLKIRIDGLTATLGFDNKRTILEKYGALFLGPDFEDKTFVDIPADPEDSREATRLTGFTDDPRIVAIYRNWLAGYR